MNINNLDQRLLHFIFSFVPHKEFGKLSQVCKNFNQVIQSNFERKEIFTLTSKTLKEKIQKRLNYLTLCSQQKESDDEKLIYYCEILKLKFISFKACSLLKINYIQNIPNEIKGYIVKIKQTAANIFSNLNKINTNSREVFYAKILQDYFKKILNKYDICVIYDNLIIFPETSLFINSFESWEQNFDFWNKNYQAFAEFIRKNKFDEKNKSYACCDYIAQHFIDQAKTVDLKINPEFLLGCIEIILQIYCDPLDPMENDYIHVEHKLNKIILEFKERDKETFNKMIPDLVRKYQSVVSQYPKAHNLYKDFMSLL